MNKDIYFLHDKLTSMADAVLRINHDESLFQFLNNIAFTINLYICDYYLVQTRSATDTEVLMNNIRDCIDGMIRCIPEKLKQFPPDDK